MIYPLHWVKTLGFEMQMMQSTRENDGESFVNGLKGSTTTKAQNPQTPRIERYLRRAVFSGPSGERFLEAGAYRLSSWNACAQNLGTKEPMGPGGNIRRRRFAEGVWALRGMASSWMARRPAPGLWWSTADSLSFLRTLSGSFIPLSPAF